VPGSAAGDPEPVSRFPPGHLFANRYRMIAPIGQGAMGEVWRAEDQTLQTEVALKLIGSTDEEGRERILKEVRLARQVTHPAVCRVFDVGESEGHVFYSMELVEAEDLATLLSRIGRLPWEKVADIGVQLCSGLAAAHAQGVLHRDLKPANVLIDADGGVRITDFGIAITHSESAADVHAGTPGYMAPEQRAGLPLGEAADVFAIGVVLYELLVGQRPFSNGVDPDAEPVRPSALVPDVHAGLEKVVLQALSADARDRPASAAGMAERLRGLGSPASARWRRPWVAAAAVGAGALVLLAIAGGRLAMSGASLTDQDTLVIADVMNSTGDPVFDGALKVALAVALEQSPFLKVFPDERVRETLRLIERPPDTALTRAVARDVARRERLKALVAASIGSFGRNYVLTLEAVDAESGDVMAREQAEVAAKEDVLRALGGATARLREKLGESLASIERFDVPLPRATTDSLEALNAYAMALDEGRMNPRREAVPHLLRALDLDPNFAMAEALLSFAYATTGQWSLAPEHSRRAFELRDRVSERERFFISWRYYVDATQAWDQALALAESWTATYPREAFAFNSLGLASAALGRHEPAVRAFREAIRLDDRFVPPFGNLVGSLIALGRFGEAADALRDARARGIDSTGLQRAAYILPLLQEDREGMAAALDAARAASSVAGALVWEARGAMFGGRFAAAHDLFQRGVRSALEQQLPDAAAQWAAEDAEGHAVAGDCTVARREVGEALAHSRDNFTLERVVRTLALCGAEADLAALSHELDERFGEATLTMRLHQPVARAALALRRGDAAQALERLDPVRSYDRVPAAEFWPSYLRGLAHLRLGEAGAARTEFAAILARRGEAPASPLYALARLGAARAAALAGEGAAARAEYERFLSLWGEADPGLAPLVEARGEYAGLP
jgi:serine/threonine protein kinase